MSTRKPTTVVAAAAPDTVNTPLRYTKRFNVLITGTMANFQADGPSAATWRPVEGRHVQIFTNASADQDLSASINTLKSTYVISARLLEQKSSFPVPLGVNVSCIPAQEHNDCGEKFTFTSLPMTHNPTPLVLFEAPTGFGKTGVLLEFALGQLCSGHYDRAAARARTNLRRHGEQRRGLGRHRAEADVDDGRAVCLGARKEGRCALVDLAIIVARHKDEAANLGAARDVVRHGAPRAEAERGAGND